MGGKKRLRKKYTKPNHPWQKERIEEEKILMVEYGMKNKKELWKMNSILKNFKQRAKILVPRKDEQAMKEQKQLMERVSSLNLVKPDAKLEDVLSLGLRSLLDRRLQTLVFRKGLSSSSKQSRQFVTHEHVYVGDKMINSPSYLVPLKEEGLIRVSDAVKALQAEPEEAGPVEATSETKPQTGKTGKMEAEAQ